VTDAFREVVRDEAGLRELFASPSDTVQRKQIDYLEDNCRAFIAHAPFVLVATANVYGGAT
jgi:predicted pyridoxine 5'-phosphate oxidase superfamily flavin-nucleotide-binding protein